MVVMRVSAVALVLVFVPGLISAQSGARRFTTIDAIRQFPGYYHLQSVTLRGELTDDPKQPMLRSDDMEMKVVFDGASAKSGPVEVRATAIDVGRLEPNDPRLTGYADRTENWPKPGEVVLLKVTAVTDAAPATTPSIRALALEPWKFDGQTVTITGNFRGRNLFGDEPAAPTGSYDFVVRGAEGAIWITGIRPRGKNFDLDLDRRVDTDKWVEVTGVVSRKRGLVAVAATKIAITERPAARIVEEPTPPPPPQPLQVVFNSPTDGEVDVSPAAPIRIQFSRGLRDSTIAGRIRVTYAGDAATTLEPKFTYDAATRSLQIRFATPLDPLKTVKVELLDGLLAFDGGALVPWSVSFSLGSR
jgi:hypothetical protein